LKAVVLRGQNSVAHTFRLYCDGSLELVVIGDIDESLVCESQERLLSLGDFDRLGIF
jgi:hypothetical protein